MFRVLPSVRLCFVFMGFALFMLLWLLGTDGLLLMLYSFVGIWFQFYLAGLKIYFGNGILVKQTGRVFDRRLVLLLRNICGVNVLSIHPSLPAVIRLILPHRDVVLVGLCGRQAVIIEKTIISAL